MPGEHLDPGAHHEIARHASSVEIAEPDLTVTPEASQPDVGQQVEAIVKEATGVTDGSLDVQEPNFAAATPESLAEEAQKHRVETLENLRADSGESQPDRNGALRYQQRLKNSDLGIPESPKERTEQGKSAKLAAVVRGQSYQRRQSKDMYLGNIDNSLADDSELAEHDQHIYGDRAEAALKVVEGNYIDQVRNEANDRYARRHKNIYETDDPEEQQEHRNAARQERDDFETAMLEPALGSVAAEKGPDQLLENREPARRNYIKDTGEIEKRIYTNQLEQDRLRRRASELFDRDPDKYKRMSNEEFVAAFKEYSKEVEMIERLRYEHLSELARVLGILQAVNIEEADFAAVSSDLLHYIAGGGRLATDYEGVLGHMLKADRAKFSEFLLSLDVTLRDQWNRSLQALSDARDHMIEYIDRRSAALEEKFGSGHTLER